MYGSWPRFARSEMTIRMTGYILNDGASQFDSRISGKRSDWSRPESGAQFVPNLTLRAN